ncbi:ribonuclease III [Gulosibacter molinativorax]|uniref:Ribonuclease 3 n=1 Tax=Gulosibacter molinativorax TaxID=256821 RepID=A0ABT7C8G2_9MICO|nr:ribonuclease III [Gulosibacter molinativorax]MDJ1371499.1 ribonuclease III [Gulosibacter molinativorax]QUY62441.1 Ribonuclease 3 [Gulosibacter molinativorax]
MTKRSKKFDPEVADPAPLAQALGVEFVPELLDLALTHSSWAYEHDGAPDNERLEFLGDSVLGLAVAQMLYEEFPDLNEGELSPRHHALVSTVTLADIARKIGLGQYLRLGKSEQLTGGIDKDSILADALEAVFGAAHLSAGFEAATNLVLGLVRPYVGDVERLSAEMDPKTALLEFIADLQCEAPEYSVTGTGPDHDRVFTANVRVPKGKGVLVEATGTGRSKKQAELAAALAAWTKLREESAAASTAKQ